MTNEIIHEGMLVEDVELITVTQLCRSCTVEVETIALLVEEGVLEPLGNSIDQWHFGVGSRRRVKTVIHLQRDLGVNLAGAALAIELLEQITELKRVSGR
jgi:chaperone modulatory protein CbpM